METTIEFTYGKHTLYITDPKELENYVNFTSFLLDNLVITYKPGYMSTYFTSNKKIVLRTFFLDVILFPDLLIKYSDLGITPTIQKFLFEVLALYCKAKNDDSPEQTSEIKMSIRTYENV